MLDSNRAESDLLRRRERSFAPTYRLFYDSPAVFTSGRGCTISDAEGRRYIDAYNNVQVLGHSHPAVVEAVSEAVRTLTTNTRYLEKTSVAYAEDLLSRFPDHIDRVVFTCTGSEANDLAIRMARAVTGHDGLLITANAYHGNTALTGQCSPGNASFFRESPAVQRIDIAALSKADDPVGALLAAVDAALAAMKAEGIEPAAVLLDPSMASDGLHPALAPAWRAAIARVRERGGLFIADEVQTGFGRCGPLFWGFEAIGAEPDIATMGKPMGGGLPLGGVVASAAVMEKFSQGRSYFNTFAGNPVSIAAAQAVLRTIDDEGLVENTARMGEYLSGAIAEAMSGCTEFSAPRQIGLFIGVDCLDPDSGRPDPALAHDFVHALFRDGVLIGLVGPQRSTLKIRPPLVFTRDEGAALIDVLSGLLPFERGA